MTGRGWVDAHHHLWDVAEHDYPWMDGPWADPLRRAFTPEDLGAVAVPAGVSATVVVQALEDEAETVDLLAAAAESPLIAGVVGWVDLTAADVASRLAALRSSPGGEWLVGVRHQVQDEADPEWLLRPDVLQGLAAVGAAGLVYDLLVKPPQLPAAVTVAQRLPQVPFVLDHLAKPDIAAAAWEPWASGVAMLAEAGPHVSAKLSGLVTEADWENWTVDQLRPYVDHAVECFGPERLMLGSDWPVCLLAADYGTVVGTAETLLCWLGGPERAAVFGGNARRVYGLR
jgi:L-fuconolactonase